MKQLKDYFKKAGGAILGIALFYYILSKFQYSTCPFLMLTGIPCPFCGMTRAAFGLLRGDFRYAWQANPMIYGLLILGIFLVIVRYRSSSGFAEEDAGKRQNEMTSGIRENESISGKWQNKTMSGITENEYVAGSNRKCDNKKRVTTYRKIVILFFILLILVYVIRMVRMFPDQWPMLYYPGNDLQRILHFI